MASENQKLKKKLWTFVSEYIRRKDADFNGYVACVTCGVVKKWQDLDCGHYHPRTDGLSTYFLEKNLAPQCRSCNSFRHGNLTRYAIWLRRKYGEQILEELAWKQQQHITISNKEYEELIKEYKNKLKELPS